MAECIEITIDTGTIEAALGRLTRSASDLRPAMRDMGGLLEKETDDNFRTQGRPSWKPLASATILNRIMGKDREGKRKGLASVFKKNGDLRQSTQRKLEGGLSILQDTGVLRKSIRAHADRDTVTIGSVLEYAAIHQFGSMAGRNRHVRIPARPFIPVDAEGNLSPEVERGVLATIYAHIAESV